jgi:hypothetical protein
VVAKSADEARRSALGTWKTTALPPSGSTLSNTASNGNAGFKGSNADGKLFVTTDPYAVEALNYNPKQRLEISKLLVGAGYLGKPTSKYTKNFADALIRASQDFSVEATRTGRPELTIRSFLTENYQPPTGGTGGPSLPQREIYKKTEADRIAMLNQVSQTLRGQELTEEDRKTDWYKTLKSSVDKMIDAGSVRTVTKQINPKTKKLESVATTVPGYSEEQVAATAEKAIRKATPEDVARKERVDFTSWMFSTLGGANG